MVHYTLLTAMLLMAASLTTACGAIQLPGGAGTPAASQQTTTGEASAAKAAVSSPPTARPASAGSGTTVKSKPDPGKAKRALVSASVGGRIEIQGDKGITYLLEIPKDALLTDELITMSPVAQVDALPMSGGLLAAVEFQPEGTRLVKPAKLTIKLPADFKRTDLMGFAYKGSGEDFHLYPVLGKGSTITTNLIHFSSYGSGQGTQADSSAQQGRQPTDAESQFEQDVAGAMEKARRTGSDESSTRDVEDVLRRFFTDQVERDLRNAESNDQVLDPASAEFINWMRTAELAGVSDRLQDELNRGLASLRKGLDNAINKASERCVQNLDWQEGLKIINRARQKQLLFGSAAGADDIRPKLDPCWRFRLDFESLVKWKLADNMNISAQVKSQVPLKMSEDWTHFEGTAPLEYVDHSVEWVGESALMNAFCDIRTETTNTTLTVSPMILTMNLSTGGPPQTRGLLDIGDTSEQWSWTCDTGSGTIRMNMPIPTIGWSTGYKIVNKKREFHEIQVNGVTQGKPKYYYYDFQPAGKTVIARETGSDETAVENGEVSEEYTIDIVHTPAGGANDTSSSSTDRKDNEQARKPASPKLTDASALPQELKAIPGPPDFGVVADSTDLEAPGGNFQEAQASWWGTGTIDQTAGFYRQALAAGWNPGDELVRQSDFLMTFTSKTDSRLTIELHGKVDQGGILVRETLTRR